tara:strand:+ start:163 stop:888 length:726 start_codon:yes stop_codon:yes gene_type:complete
MPSAIPVQMPAPTIPSRTKLDAAQVRLAFAKILNSGLFDGVDIDIITNMGLLLDDEYLGYKNKYKMKWDEWVSRRDPLLERASRLHFFAPAHNPLSVNLGEGDEMYNFTFDDLEIGNRYYYHSIDEAIVSNGIIEISKIIISPVDAYFLIIITVNDISKFYQFDIIFSFCIRKPCAKVGDLYQWNNYVHHEGGYIVDIKKFKKFSSNEPSWYNNKWYGRTDIESDEPNSDDDDDWDDDYGI